MFLQLLEHYGQVLPAKKLADVRMAIQYIRWRIARPLRLTANEHKTVQEYASRLKQTRKFKEASES